MNDIVSSITVRPQRSFARASAAHVHVWLLRALPSGGRLQRVVFGSVLLEAKIDIQQSRASVLVHLVEIWWVHMCLRVAKAVKLHASIVVRLDVEHCLCVIVTQALGGRLGGCNEPQQKVSS